jgi:formylglycine-generating enzyme required for sulfatase activity
MPTSLPYPRRIASGLLPFGGLVLAGALTAPTAGRAPAPAVYVERARHANYTETIPGSRVRFDMVAVPGGVYRMGSPGDERGRGDDEGPQHPVAVRPFWMGKCEVTWDEYDLFRSATRGRPAAKGKARPGDDDVDAISGPTEPYPDESRGFGKVGRPVVGISHHAAMVYCRWLSLKTGKVYRLPTEAEWEFACRAGTATAYPFGNRPSDLDEYAWYEKNADDCTHPVGGKRPNRWGLHDMLGNVAEWCLDPYRKDGYAAFPLDKVTPAPVRLPTARRFPHVVRGGSWADAAERCRSAARRASDPSWNKMDPARPQTIWWLWDADFVGFRVVHAVEEQEELRGLRPKVTRDSP